MSFDLSEQQMQSLDAGEAVRVTDGSRVLYGLTKEQYERVKGLLELEDVDASLYEAGEIHLHDSR